MPLSAYRISAIMVDVEGYAKANDLPYMVCIAQLGGLNYFPNSSFEKKAQNNCEMSTFDNCLLLAVSLSHELMEYKGGVLCHSVGCGIAVLVDTVDSPTIISVSSDTLSNAEELLKTALIAIKRRDTEVGCKDEKLQASIEDMKNIPELKHIAEEIESRVQ